MRIRPKRIRAWVVLLALLAPAGAVVQADQDSVIYFKNGRALRVLDYRQDGDWVYLVLSEPKKPEAGAKAPGKAEKPEDLVREIGVLADTITRIEDARTARGGSTSVNPITGTANGVVRSPSSYDSVSSSRGYVVENQPPPSPEELAMRLATNTEKVPNTPSMQEGSGGIDVRRSQEELNNIDLSKTVAGQAMMAPLNHSRVPTHILERAKQLNEQRRAERQRRQAEAAKQAAEGGGDPGSDR